MGNEERNNNAKCAKYNTCAMFVRLAFFYSEKEESRESEAVINAFDSRSENR